MDCKAIPILRFVLTQSEKLSKLQDDNEEYYGRVFKEFRFALAAVGDESEPCPQQEAPWEFRSRCFKSFGKYTGNQLENEVVNQAKNCVPDL